MSNKKNKRIVEGNFTRIPPISITEDLALGWFAISHRWMEEKQIRRDAYGKLYRIKTDEGVIYRTLRFSPRLKGAPSKDSGQILMDWHGWIQLSKTGEEKYPERMKIKKANIFEIFWHSASHPDPAYRHSMAIARIGLYISLVSIILSFK